MYILKSRDEIEKMRRANAVVAEALEAMREVAAPGVSTLELDETAMKVAEKHKVRPAFLNYRGFPASVCASVNEEVVHGIPSRERKLNEGDIVGLDFGVFCEGYCGDAAITVGIGKVSEQAQRLIDATRQALEKAIEVCRPGNYIGDIGAAIEDRVLPEGFSVVRQFVGHGIGQSMHEEPQVLNYRSGSRGIKFKPGLVLAIEPMINAGTYQVRVLSDGWTAVTADGKLSAHFEHSVAITENGPYVLSKL